MHRIQPNQLSMHPFFMYDDDLAARRFEETDFEEENRHARRAVVRVGAGLVCLFASMGAIAHLHHRVSNR